MTAHHPNHRRYLAVALGLVVATLAVYWPVMKHPFVNYDDPTYVTGNARVLEGLTPAGVRWAFRTYHAANWHPLTWLSHMLDVEIYGLRSGGHHATNLLLHVVNSVLLFMVMARLTQACAARGGAGPTGRGAESAAVEPSRGADWRCAFVAAMFALHPLHVESVAWVSERKDLLSTLFAILTLGAYANYAKRPSLRSAWYLLALLFFVLGLLSKPMLVTLPFVLLLLDYWPLERLRRDDGGTKRCRVRGLVWEKLPFLVLAILSCWVTLQAQRAAVAPLHEVPMLVRVTNAAVSYECYLAKIVLPIKLSVYYPLRLDANPWRVGWAVALLMGISAVVFGGVKRRPWLLVGWCWFLGMLVPVIGLVQVGGQAMADRYTYMPMIGLSIMVAWSVPSKLASRGASRWAIVVAAGAFLAMWGYASSLQVHHWKDGETLFRHALAVTTDNELAHKNLGNILRQQGRLSEAITQYEQALRINPSYAQAQLILAMALREAGRRPEAIVHYEQALRLDPSSVEAHNNLGNLCFEMGRFADAIRHYEGALRVSHDNADVHKNLGTALQRIGDTPQAVMHFERALALARAAGRASLVADVEGRLQRARGGTDVRGAP